CFGPTVAPVFAGRDVAGCTLCERVRWCPWECGQPSRGQRHVIALPAAVSAWPHARAETWPIGLVQYHAIAGIAALAVVTTFAVMTCLLAAQGRPAWRPGGCRRFRIEGDG